MLSVYVVCWIFLQTFQTCFCIQANSVDSDQTVPRGAVWSGSTLFAEMTFKLTSRRQSRRQLSLLQFFFVCLLCNCAVVSCKCLVLISSTLVPWYGYFLWVWPFLGNYSTFTLVLLNKLRCHSLFKFSANQITWSRLLIQIHILNGMSNECPQHMFLWTNK